MKFKLDENLPRELVALLHEAKHDALTVIDQDLGGSQDLTVAEICQAEERALVTLDLDFSDVRAYPPNDYFGIVVVRAWRQDKQTILSLLRRVLPLIESERLTGRLWIVEESRVRIRGE